MLKYLITSIILMLTSTLGYSLEVNTERAIPITGPITPDSLSINDQLLKLSSDGTGDPIDLVINSPGGYVNVGFRIISVMEHVKASGTTIRCFVPGYAASMAFQILLHCDERYALDVAQLLFHRVRVFIGGDMFGGGTTVLTGPDASTLARDLLLIDRAIFRDLREHIRASRAWLLYHFNKETFHIAANLCRLDPKFISCHKSIGNLIPYAIENSSSSDIKVKQGTIIYMKKGS